MPVNDTTTNRSYQKPNIANTLSDDVGRLRSALDAIDTDMASKAPTAGPTFTGVVAIAGGSAAAPSLAFTGDTNTGIYSPGADQLAISTGGAGRLFVDASGRLGIGTGSPRQALTFGGLTSTSTASPDCIDLGATYTSTTASTNLKLKLYVDSSGNTYGFTTNGSSELEYYAGTVPSPGNHVFLTGGSERARIDSSGRLGIGTNSPNHSFQVGATGAAGVAIDATNSTIHGTFGSGGEVTLRAQLVSTSGGGQIFLGGSTRGDGNVNSIVFSNANTERARIDSSGRLLVGTSTESGGALLQVNGDRIRVGSSKTPASASATGTAGEICWDASYIYVCTATNTWKRTAIATW